VVWKHALIDKKLGAAEELAKMDLRKRGDEDDAPVNPDTRSVVCTCGEGGGGGGGGGIV